jgi:UDP-3-O-[3-hydroxymyristoyl] glucosamine N-acyltransferase
VKLSAIAARIGVSLPPGAENREIFAIVSPQNADERHITFVSRKEYRATAEASRCAAVIVRKGESIPGKISLETDDPYVAYAKVAQLFEDTSSPWGAGIDISAIIDPSARVAASTVIGPLTVVGADVTIGAECMIGAACVIESGTTIGERCRIDSGAIIRRHSVIGNRVIIQSGAVIGSEGFGNARENNRYLRIPCFGTVVVEDDVEIGAGTTIDRGSFDSTIIRRGSKLDNLIHIAHNVIIGYDTAIAAQTGIAGSTTVGDRVIIAGQVGCTGHIEIGDDAFIAAKAGVSKSVNPGAKITGYPARDLIAMRRIEACQAQLPDLLKEIKRLRRELEELKGNFKDCKLVK